MLIQSQKDQEDSQIGTTVAVRTLDQEKWMTMLLFEADGN
jgi:hypothetical protein